MKRLLLLSTCLAFLVGTGFSQNLSNRGREFWVGYGHHQFMEPGQSNTQEMVLYFSAEPGQPANVTVTVRGRTATQVTTYNVPAGTVIASNFMPKAGANDCRLYDVPPTFGGNGGEGVFIMSIHIESDVPIVAYAHTFGSASSGATMLMPVETYGYAYVSINSKQVYANNCFSWAYVVASHDNTVVQITPSVLTRLGKPAGVPFNVTLNKGEIYQIIGANPSNGSTALEVSGTKFKSIANPMGECYPVAVFSGSSRTTNPISCGSGGGDNDNQQCFPTQAWGKRYLTAPTSRSTAANQFMTNSFKVLVNDPTTVVKRNGTVLSGLQQNSFYFFESNSADIIEADKPIMVAQFMTGGGCMGGGVGDPEMIYISPLEQGIKRIGFYRNTREAITVNYLTLIIPNNGVSSLRIDGSPSFDHSYAHPRLPGYTVVVKRWSSAQAQAIVTSDSAFTAITYGLGSVESYGYNAGTLINNLNAISSIQNVLDPATPQHAYTCEGAPVKISALMAYQPTRINWLLSQMGSDISPNADIIDMSPVSVGTVIQNGITYYKYELAGTYTFSGADTFYVPLQGYNVNIENCYQREDLTIKIIVKPKPVAEFSFSHTGCELDTVYFTGSGTTSNNYTIRDFNWTFPGPVLETGQNVNKLLPVGTHTINLSVVTQEGCVDDTTRTITVYDRPPAEFQIVPASLCEGSSFTITDTSSATIAVNEWFWDFGNGDTQTSTTGAAVNYTYAAPGTYTIKHVSKSSVTCHSDTVSRTVTVYSKPVLGLNFTNGCLQANGQVQFNSTSSVPDAQSLTYAWDFGDPNANVGNPNTSTLANPTHDYTVYGTFTINLAVTTNNGCTKDTTFDAVFDLKPALFYFPLNPVCESDLGTISVANATVTNGVPGNGSYRGPGTTSTGDFDPSMAGAGTHTIWYKFTSSANCEDSISQTILVRAKPVVDFIQPAGCLPTNGQILFTNTSSVPDGQLLSYTWDFGDGTGTSTLQNPTHIYSTESSYNVKLTVTTDNNCISDKTVAIPISIKPQLTYPALLTQCENIAGPINIASATVTNSITGNGIYSGPGTDANGNFSPLAAGAGTHSIWYKFTTTGGCVDSVSQTIQVRARPLASYTFPAGCMPTGQLTFTNTSSVPDAQTLSYTWDFGDGSPTSTITNPLHNYSGEGIYDVKLTVTTNNNCIKDTTVRVPISIKPQFSYPALPVQCENINGPVSVATATVTNGLNGTGVYSGPATSANGDFSPLAAGAGTHTLWYKFTTAGGCIDSVSQTIQVRARPVANYSFIAGCLPTNGQLQFTNSSSISDGQALSYVWDFGDGTSTSTSTSPAHNFTAEGTYNVKLTVATNNGCIKDTTVAVAVAINPLFQPNAALPAVCEDAPAFSITPATILNGVTGTGIYSGQGIVANGLFSPLAAGSGIQSLWYVFTTNGGCKDSTSTTILVNPKPASSFTIDADICLNQTATITDNSTIISGNITNWNWNFGDGNTAAYSNGNTFTRSYTSFNNYSVQLVTTSNNGCKDTVTQNIAVHDLPKTDFSLPASVCMPNGVTALTNQTTIGDNSGISYTWDFGDGSPLSNQASPSHVYSAIGSYTINLSATSAYGCLKDTMKVMSAFFDKPVADFLVDPLTLCQGTDNTFTDLSTAPNSTVASWAWDFDDGSTSVSKNPVKRFLNPGIYDVNLTVKNAVGCVSDVATKQVTVYLQPVIDAGPSFVVPQGTLVQLKPTANDSTVVSFVWSPPTNLSSSTILRPLVNAVSDQVYTLTAYGPGGCNATDEMSVKILKLVKIPNVFSPNGDAINDKWMIQNLSDYPGAFVEIFNRYGQRIFYSAGYNDPWDGTYNGKPMPVATYYYVITLKNGFEPLTGSVTIIR